MADPAPSPTLQDLLAQIAELRARLEALERQLGLNDPGPVGELFGTEDAGQAIGQP